MSGGRPCCRCAVVLGVGLHHAEHHRPPGLLGDAADPVDFGMGHTGTLAIHAARDNLEHTCAELGQLIGNRLELGFLGISTGYDAAGVVTVREEPRDRTPSAPACMPSRTMAQICASSSSVASPVAACSPITRWRTAEWGTLVPTSTTSGGYRVCRDIGESSPTPR